MPDLITVRTSDGVALDGAWYPATGVEIAALLIPGRAQNFYTSVVRWLAPMLAKHGIPALALNTRDHDHAEIDGIPAGSRDIAAGLDFLAARGYPRYLLAGISYGSNKAALFAPQAGPELAALLLGPVGGIKSYRADVWAQALDGLGHVTAPTLILQAGADEHIPQPELAGEEAAAAASGADVQLVVIPGADHGFSAHEEEVEEVLTRWLTERVSAL